MFYVLCAPQTTEERASQQRGEPHGEMSLCHSEVHGAGVGMGHRGVVAEMGEGHQGSGKWGQRVIGRKGQARGEHGGLPTGMCAHTPVNTFSSEPGARTRYAIGPLMLDAFLQRC